MRKDGGCDDGDVGVDLNLEVVEADGPASAAGLGLTALHRAALGNHCRVLELLLHAVCIGVLTGASIARFLA